MKSTKPKPENYHGKRIETLLESVQRIRQERESGFGIKESITYLEYESLLIFDSFTAQAIRETQVMTRMLNERNLEIMRMMTGNGKS